MINATLSIFPCCTRRRIIQNIIEVDPLHTHTEKINQTIHTTIVERTSNENGMLEPEWRK